MVRGLMNDFFSAGLPVNRVKRTLSTRSPADHTASAKALAAVAAIVDPKSASVLLIRRAQRNGDPWSGHMAFPGGRHEQQDADLLETATRETWEEVGLDLRSHGEVLGRLDDLPTHRKGLVVRPFVFALTDEPSFELNHEVAEILWAPLASLQRGAHDTSYRYEHEGTPYSFPAYDVEGRVVWGLTYRMLRSFFGLLAP